MPERVTMPVVGAAVPDGVAAAEVETAGLDVDEDAVLVDDAAVVADVVTAVPGFLPINWRS